MHTDTISIVIVDDEAAFAAALAKRLGRRGFDVRSAPGGGPCLQALGEASADVVVLDLRMPDMDGLEALRRIRDAHPRTQVILLSGHGSREAATECARLGAFAFMMKPADLDELAACIEHAAAAAQG